MRKIGGKILFSATDLVNFLGCRHCTWLDLKDLEQPLEKAESDAEKILLKEKGLEHERAYLERLREQGLAVAEIPQALSMEERVRATAAEMAAGADVIYQAALLGEPWHGYADFLRRVPAPPNLGPWSYEVVDTKLARTPRPYHVMQLCVYSDLLARIQGAEPHSMHLVLGDGRAAAFRFSAFAHYYANARRRFERFVHGPPAESHPEPCRLCDTCRWRDRCSAQWETDDHLTLVANIQRSQIRKLNDAGITTVRALAQVREGGSVRKLAEETLARLRAQARLQVQKRDTGQNVYELLDAPEGRGFQRLPRPDDGDLFFDIEGDPLYPDGLEYLFGFYYFENGKPVFKPFWAHEHDRERAAFQEVMDFITRELERHPGAHIYHYNHYEETAIKRLASRYGTREAAVDDLLRRGKLVDLFKVVREAIRVSEPRYTLKNLETFYMEKREGEVKTAADSIVVYERWRQTGDAALLDEIRSYNEADCRSAHGLRDWLLFLRREGAPWANDSRQPQGEKSTQHQEEAEVRRLDHEQRLLEGCPVEERPVRELVAQLLEFHRREAKPEWWAMFDRRDRYEEELIEDPECLGGLRLDSNRPAFFEKTSMVFTYCFPPQDTKLGKDDDCLIADTLERAGKVHFLDAAAGVVQIKRARKLGPLPEELSIIPPGPIGDEVLRKALYRFAQSLIAGGGRYPALESVLKRELPRIAGHRPGSPVIRESEDLLEGTIRAVRDLRESHLLIQGPPGAGKTFASSHAILKLIRSGRRVGVASNSHKAINNLLRAVEKHARERDVRFRGVKKSTGPATFFDGEMIRDVTNNSEVSLSVDLIAGTAWLFAREELDRALDCLFVDEAGQVSLANIVAMGMSARNIVLVGDQMQLAQPVQGVHPGESGSSVLEYLLKDWATVPPERGVFLATTWRMHENVCRFISDAVYDSRLHPEPHNQNQRLILTGDAHPALAPSGIRFVEVGHQGCAQKSEEEGRVIHEIYASLLRQQYRDRGGAIHPMTTDNILVVSPYNMQVNHLKSILPSGARVGTVDKFQGQEAEVVLISMATSSGEDLPRNIEFLFSKNRLNVAISRARCLAVIVASPALLEIPCRTVEELELVNTLCHARECGDVLGCSK